MSIFSTICRSCLGINLDVINLFSPFGMLDSNDNLTFSDCFTIITNIKVEINDNMPQTICKRCLTELKVAFNFRKKCEVSDITLKSKCLKKEEDASVGKYDDIDGDGDMLIEALDEVQFDENDVVVEDADQGTIEIVIHQDTVDLQHSQVKFNRLSVTMYCSNVRKTTQLRRSSRRRKSEWNKSTEHLEEYMLTQEEHIESVKDEGHVEMVELSDNEFTVENDDVKDEYGHEADGIDEQEPSNEEFELHDKSIIEENDFECYECQLTFSNVYRAFVVVAR